jgi:diguanylate cyclase (GGDEF)-like protein/PAS domain S-box-containing protein
MSTPLPSTAQPETARGAWWLRVHAALMPDYNRKAAVYWWTIVAVGMVTLLHAGWSVAMLPMPALFQVLIGCTIAMAAGMFPVRISGSANSFAAGELFIFLLLLIHGPAAATLAAAGEAFVGSARTSGRWTSRLASPCTAGISMTLAGAGLWAVSEPAAMSGAVREPVLLLCAMAFSAIYFLLNTLMINLVVVLKRNLRVSARVIFGGVQWVGITYAASALVAALLYLTFKQIGMGVLLASIPMIAMLLSTLHYHVRHREAYDAARLERIAAAEREAQLAAQHAQALADSERRFHSAFSHAAIGMALVSPQGRVMQANAALCSLLVQQEADIVGRYFGDFVHEDDVPTLGTLLDVLNQADNTAELCCHRALGRDVWVAVHSTHFSEPGSTQPCLILQVEDVTARRAAEARLQHVAYHDSLTLLPNRARFSQCLAVAIERCKTQGRHFAVMYLDFDRFKLINDTLGHSAGDQFLVMVARRIRELVRPADTVGRLGGDEFAILVDDIDADQVAVMMAERLQHALCKPYVLDRTEVNSSASIGITFSSAGYDEPDEVLRDADIAMYRAKSTGRARYALFDAELRAQISDQVQLEADLRRALEQDQLSLAYQPIYDLKTGKIVSFEALVRWDHPRRGFVAPSSFVPIAEEAGLITDLTRAVLAQACRQLKAWHEQGHAELHMQVNLSAMDLSNSALAGDVDRTLRANGLKASSLTLEITESTLMTRLGDVMETLAELREVGVGLSVDDFGTGYSSLSYLSTLPITGLKIDRSFITRMLGTTQDAEIVKTIIALGAALGKTVVAEGIENAAQLGHLCALGCGFGQGFWLGCPLSAETAQALLGAVVAVERAVAMPMPAADTRAALLH